MCGSIVWLALLSIFISCCLNSGFLIDCFRHYSLFSLWFLRICSILIGLPYLGPFSSTCMQRLPIVSTLALYLASDRLWSPMNAVFGFISSISWTMLARSSWFSAELSGIAFCSASCCFLLFSMWWKEDVRMNWSSAECFWNCFDFIYLSCSMLTGL